MAKLNTNKDDQSTSFDFYLNDADPTTTKAEADCLTINWRILGHNQRREMSVSEFAKEARISRQAVFKMIAGGRLNAKRIGEQYVIEPEELERYLRTK